MSERRPLPFTAPSESFLRRLVETPVFDLLHGRVNGAGNPRRLLADSGLPESLVAGAWILARSVARRRGELLSQTSRLIGWSKRQLEEGRTAADIAAELRERSALARFDRAQAIAERPLATRLPDALHDTIRQVVRAGTWRWRCRKSVARAIYERCVAELTSGVPPQRLIEQFAEVGDVVPLLNEPVVRSLTLEAALPVPLLKIVQAVVRRTHLWPSERREVARELCAHFADGLAEGRPADELAESFGPVPTAARLIRRARIRNRGPLWQVWRRGSQGAILVLLLASVFWGYRLIRLHSAAPPPRFDLVGEVDAARASVPPADRGWLFYRDALEALTEAPASEKSG